MYDRTDIRMALAIAGWSGDDADLAAALENEQPVHRPRGGEKWTHAQVVRIATALSVTL
ncbi:hypothetical protein KUV85_06795 [Nocardioides panacisoli]|uniref:hypothetical protein n=1 Tax=Nocardioides panacisoli TaxID=627624 RepID=UPI001C636DC9|nr:hypothetical protein [Nocardioides panacisoli]QYJ05381.1 hypothetical protein KUV85_06795 [Nocardioides panacisoli]